MAVDDYEDMSYLAGYAPIAKALPTTPTAAIPEGGFKNAFAQSIGGSAEGIGQLAGDFVPGVSQNNALKKWGTDYSAAHPTAVHSLEDIKASPWLATKEALGGAAGFMLPMVATAPLGGGLAAVRGAGALSSVARGAGAALKSRAGQASTMMPASYGGIREAQGEDAQSIQDKLLALGGAGISAGIETAFGPQQWAMQAMGKEGRAALATKFSGGSLLKRTGVGAIKGAGIEGAEELVQNPIEQLAAYQNPTTEKNLRDTLFGAAMGGLGGGVMGGAFGAAAGRSRDLTKPASNEAAAPTTPLGLPNLPQTVDYTHADGSVEKMDTWTAAYNDAEREVAGTADTGWTPETSKAHADYVQSGGAERTYAEATPTDNVRPYDPEARQRAVSGLMQTEEGTQNLIDYHKSLQQSPAVDQAVSALEDHLTELKKSAASAFSTKQTVTPRGSFPEKGNQTQKSLLTHQIGEYLGKGLITPEQHMDFVNDLAQPGVKTLKVKSDVLKAIKDTRSAKVAEVQARKDAVIAEAAAKKVAVSEARKAARAAKKVPTPTKEKQNAIQIKEPSKGVQRRKRPEVGLQKVGKGNAQPQEAAAKSEVKKEVKGPKLKVTKENISAQETAKTKPTKAQQQKETPAADLAADVKAAEAEADKEIARKKQVSSPTKTIQALAKEHSDLHNALGRAEEEEDFGAQLEVMDKLKKFASDNKADMKAIEAARARFEAPQETAEEHIPEADAYGNEIDEKTDWDNRHSESAKPDNPVAAKKLAKILKGMFRGAALFDKIVRIYATQEEAAVDGNLSGAKGRVLGFKTPDGKVGLIAENIEDGKELGVFLHEVGVHLGMEKLIGKVNMRWLDSRILEWAALNDGSKESEAAKAAVARSEDSTTDDNAEGRIAYMTEELVNRGVKPKATVGGIEGWLYRLIGSMRVALVKLGLRSAWFSGQSLVDLAHGAAGIELGVIGKPAELSPERQVGLKFSEKTRSVGNEDVINSFLTSAREHIPTTKSEFVKYAAMMPFTRDLAKWASKYMPAANNLWDAINSQMSDTRKLSLDVHAVSQDFLNLKSSGQDLVQHFLHDGKMSGKWGFQPEWLKGKLTSEGKQVTVPTSPEMVDKWRELKAADKQAAKVAEATLKLFHTLRQEEIKAVQTSVEDFRRYADSLQDKETQKSVLADVNNQLAALRLLASYQGPYVPTLRFGDYYVKAKSAAYLAAEAAEDMKAMTAMKADGKNYVYTHVQSQSAANALAKDLSAKYAGGKIEALPIKGRPEARKADYTALLNLESLLKKNADKKGAGQVREMLNTLLNAMSDEHAESQSRQQFKAVYGANYKETMRGAAMRGQQMAFKIGALKNARKASNALFDMGKQVDDMTDQSDKASATHLLTEFRKRYEGGLDGTETSNAIQSILGGVSLWKLLTNPMYYLTQLAQPYQYSIPSMVKYGLGYNASWKAMFDERKTLLEVWKKSGGVFRVDEDLSWVKNDKERGMLEWLRERNLLDMGMESEVGALEGANPAKQAIEKWAFRPLRNAVQNTEIVNRVSTALAAYKLAIRQGKTEKQAKEIVENVLHESHGQYAGTNAPRYLNQKGVMRIPMQFRKFQLIQATFLFQNIWKEVQKLPDPTQRAAAARTIAATLGHTLAVAGLRGSVLWLVVQALVTAAGAGDDDKDPRDVETKVHDWLSDNASPEFANFVMFGAPTIVGVNISARTGVNPLTVLPFDNQSVLGALSSMKDFKENAFALGFGAAGSTAADMIDGFDMMSQGKIYKGLEKTMPSAIKNLMQAGRYATEGVTKRNGDVTMRPDEVTWWDMTQQALGAPSASVKEIQRKTGAVHDITTNFKTEADKLKSDYVSAFEDKDVAGMKDARDKWMSMSASMRKLGLNPQPITAMLKAPVEKRKRERNVVSGVETSKQTRGLLQNVS